MGEEFRSTPPTFTPRSGGPICAIPLRRLFDTVSVMTAFERYRVPYFQIFKFSN